MNRLVAVLLLVAGVIHLLPLPGLLGSAMLQRLYGIAIDDAGALLLLRHRAVLFALLGLALSIAAFRSAWRAPVIAAGLCSTATFLLLAGNPSALSVALHRVWLADVLALAALLVAAIGEARDKARAPDEPIL